jgi:MFS family permease
MIMLLRCPIVIIISLFLSIAYSYMYLLFTTFTDVFGSSYGFNAGQAGLSYLGLGIGFLVGQYTFDVLVQWRIRQLSSIKQNMEPEDQLPPLILDSLLIATGLFWYGWSAEYKVHWIVPIVGTLFCGIGITYFFLVVQAYLVEAYTLHAASALAASVFIRCVFGVTIPLAGPPLYSSLGLGWGSSLLGFFALAVAPASILLMKYGKVFRTNSKFMHEL